jgi:signal transduction histidine kinase
MIFSKRLTNPLAHLLFILFSLFVMAILEPDVKSQPHTVIALIGVVGIWVLIGTAGWQMVRVRELSALVTAYFIFQILWLVLIMLVEVQSSIYGPATAALAIPLIFQSSVLRFRWRIFVFALLTVLAILFTIRNLTGFERILPVVISYGVGFGLLLIISNLITGGERAIQRSLKLAEYATNVEELATLRERNRLAREIHDNLGHYFNTLANYAAF